MLGQSTECHHIHPSRDLRNSLHQNFCNKICPFINFVFQRRFHTFATKFAFSECIRRTLRQGGNADRSMTLFSFACFFWKSNHRTLLIFFSPYPCKLHTYSSNLLNFCNIFQHFNFSFLKMRKWSHCRWMRVFLIRHCYLLHLIRNL